MKSLSFVIVHASEIRELIIDSYRRKENKTKRLIIYVYFHEYKPMILEKPFYFHVPPQKKNDRQHNDQIITDNNEQQCSTKHFIES